MNLRSVTKVALAVGLWLGTLGCSRDSIEAIDLANQGDQSIKVNVEGAIQKYEQARQLDPTNHLIIYKLAKAYEKKEDWDKMASTLSQAAQVAPTFATYWFKRGYALVKKAENDNNNKDTYQEAMEPLKKCVETDPNLAECYNLLGQAHLWNSDDQAAIENYTKAIEHDPTSPFYYVDLVYLYIEYRLYKEAEGVLKEATRLIPENDKSADKLYTMYVMLADVERALGDKAGLMVALEKADKFAGEGHPENAFQLGGAYATADPPQKEKAVRMLNSFTKRACRSKDATKFKDQCEQAQSMLQKLEDKK